MFFSRCFELFVSWCQCIYFLINYLPWPRCMACLLKSSLNLRVCGRSLQQSRCLSSGHGRSLLSICNRIQLLLLLKAEQNLQAAASGICPIKNCEASVIPLSGHWKRRAFQSLAGSLCQPRVAFHPASGKVLNDLPGAAA